MHEQMHKTCIQVQIVHIHETCTGGSPIRMTWFLHNLGALVGVCVCVCAILSAQYTGKRRFISHIIPLIGYEDRAMWQTVFIRIIQRATEQALLMYGVDLFHPWKEIIISTKAMLKIMCGLQQMYFVAETPQPVELPLFQLLPSCQHLGTLRSITG
jgi:hypothetical protein